MKEIFHSGIIKCSRIFVTGLRLDNLVLLSEGGFDAFLTIVNIEEYFRAPHYLNTQNFRHLYICSCNSDQKISNGIAILNKIITIVGG